MPQRSRDGAGKDKPGGVAPWIIGVVVVAMFLAAALLLRSGDRDMALQDEAAISESRTPLAAAARSGRTRQRVERADGDGWGSDARVEPGRPAVPRNTPSGRRAEVAAPVVPAVAETPALDTAVRRGAMVVTPALSVGFDGSPSAANGVEPLQADGLEIDEALGAARFLANAIVKYPDSGGVDTTAGTIVFWVHMEWDSSLPERRSKTLAELRAGGWENRIEMNLGPPTLVCLFTNSEGFEQAVGTNISWQLGEWHHVAVTWGDSIATLYVDGAIRSERELVGVIEIPAGTPLYVGSTYNGPIRAGQGSVSLRAWAVFQEPLLAEEVAELMVQTAPPT